jgi:hypothetical protein
MAASIHLSPRVVIRTLIVIVGLLVLIDSALNVIQYRFGHDTVFGLNHLMDLGREGSLPTWYASMQLAAAGMLLSIIAVSKVRGREKHAIAWCVLSAGFLFMSFDEAAEVHETWGKFVSAVPREGIFYFSWVVVAIPLCVGLFIFFIGLLRSLSARTRNGMLLSAAVFLGGVLGMELVSGVYLDGIGIRNSLTYSMLNVLENGMELLGIALFIRVLVRQLSEEFFPIAQTAHAPLAASTLPRPALAPD